LDFEIFQLGKVNLSPTLRGTVDDPGDDALKIVGEGWRVSHDATLCFQHRADLLIASILIVPGDELRGAAGNSCDQDLPGREFHVVPDFIHTRDERRQIRELQTRVRTPHLLTRDTSEEVFEGTERPSHHRYKPVPNGVGADSAHLFPRELKKLSRPNLTAPRLEIKRNVKQ
jgi:hypothetical protein